MPSNSPLIIHLLIIASLSGAFPQSPGTESNLSRSDIEQCHQVVELYCNAWKTGKCDTLFTLISKQDSWQEAMKRYINSTCSKEGAVEKINDFEIKEVVPNNEDVVVKVDISFNEQKKLVMMSGVKAFYIIKEKKKWRIKAVVEPIIPPDLKSGIKGSHPGL